MRIRTLKVFIILIIFILNACYKEKYEGKLSYTQEIVLGKLIDSLLFKKLEVIDTAITSDKIFLYNFLDTITKKITSSQKIILTENQKYIYRIFIDTGINIFNLPGNYIYASTGLLKKLNNSAQLACGLAHFIAHNDRRHQTTNLENYYGINVLLKALYGDTTILLKISNNIVSNNYVLKFTEEQEEEAIKYAIYFLEDVKYYDITEMISFEKYLEKSESLKNFHNFSGNKENFIINLYKNTGIFEGYEDKSIYDIFKSYLPL